MDYSIEKSVEIIKNRLGEGFELCIVLGSGYGGFVDRLDDKKIISYSDIPGFGTSKVKGHSNRLVCGTINGKKVLVMQGRLHYYEGHSQWETTYPIRVFSRLGIKTLILTNAAGGVNKDFVPGDLMIITDHINFSGTNPLIGEIKNEKIVRFPDMSEVYSKNLIEKIKSIDNELKEGVYMFFSGPSYETPAEVKMASIMGASAVGMSTVPEAIVANALGMEIAAISCIANMASGISEKALDHKDILNTNKRVEERFAQLIFKLVEKI